MFSPVVGELFDATDRSTEVVKDLFPLSDMLVVRLDQDGKLVEQYHPKTRMPVILNDEGSRRRWLDPDVVERPAIYDLISAFPAD